MIIIKDYDPQTVEAFNDGANTVVSLGFDTVENAQLFYNDMVAAQLSRAVVLGGTHVIINVDEIINIQTS